MKKMKQFIFYNDKLLNWPTKNNKLTKNLKQLRLNVMNFLKKCFYSNKERRDSGMICVNYRREHWSWRKKRFLHKIKVINKRKCFKIYAKLQLSILFSKFRFKTIMLLFKIFPLVRNYNKLKSIGNKRTLDWAIYYLLLITLY